MKPIPSSGETAPDEGQVVLSPRPLVVAAGSLLRGGGLVERFAALAKHDPLRVLQPWGWNSPSSGDPVLGERLPGGAEPWTVNVPLAEFAGSEAGRGRRVFLVTTAVRPSADELMAQFPFAAGIIAVPAEGPPGLRARVVADELVRLFPEGFDYAGGSADDLDVWRRARGAVLVHAPPRLERRIAALVPVSTRIAAPSMVMAVLEGMRLHQWAKNLLVFAPIVLGGRLDEMEALLPTIAAFFALGLVASSTYLINDILDVADDRRHWSKRRRPIARGDLPAHTALAWALVGLAAGLALAAVVSRGALAVVLIYLALTFSYSLYIKRLPLADGLVLATQYTLRLALGVAAAQVPPSPWLFVFSMFLFTSLCLAKRYTELARATGLQHAEIAGRGYRPADAPLVLAVGIGAGLGAVIILILYIIEDAFRQSFYGRTECLWVFPAVIFLLICRMWLVTTRGEMHDDPVRFMLADRVSQGLLVILVLSFAFAWLG